MICVIVVITSSKRRSIETASVSAKAREECEMNILCVHMYWTVVIWTRRGSLGSPTLFDAEDLHLQTSPHPPTRTDRRRVLVVTTLRQIVS